MKVCVVALGKIGLPLAVQFASKGHQVIGADVNAATVDLVNAGSEPFPGEAQLAGKLAEVVAGGLLTATTDTPAAVAQSEVVVVVVPLFVDAESRPDFGWMDAATMAIARGLKPGTLVSYETTLPVGTTRERYAPMLAEGSGLRAAHARQLRTSSSPSSRTRPHVTLAVAGRQPDAMLWASVTERLGERVTYLGWLSRADLAGEMSRCSLGLSTYANVPTNDVNRPNKMFEAEAAGLPVVATPNGSNPGVRRTGGRRIPHAGILGGGPRRHDQGCPVRPRPLDEHCGHGPRAGRARRFSGGSEASLLCLYLDLADSLPARPRRGSR